MNILKKLKINLFRQITFRKKSRVLRTTKPTPPWVKRFRILMYLFSIPALAILILEAGLRYQLPLPLPFLARFIEHFVIISFILNIPITIRFTIPRTKYIKNHWLDLLILVSIASNTVPVQAATGLIIIRHLIILLKIFFQTNKFINLLRGIRLNTAQIIAFSFILTILIGTILLTFPTATTDGKGAGFIDALFTSTSATCVTGLIVQDTSTYFTRFGQIVILILIQLGGLGIMTYSAFFALVIGRFSLGQRKIVQELFEEEQNIYNMIFYIFKMTIIVELIGAVLLFFRWNFYFSTPLKALYFSLFHSVSAFCNAGFSLFSNSLSNFVSDPAINFIIMFLIILGGLGFIVVHEMTYRLKKSRRQFSPHTKLILVTSASLIVAGFLAIFFFEFDGVLLNHSVPAKIWSSLFQSVTTRTAGFNTIPISALSGVTLTIMIVLMFIGASPGSTGGGIKTSTFAILILSVKSLIQGKRDIEVFKRSIPYSCVMKTLALLVSAMVLVSLTFLLLLAIENKPYQQILFETVSAFGTVGLSTGITPNLTNAGKLLITILMYLGRIGPLTLGLALAKDITQEKISYPEARVMIG